MKTNIYLCTLDNGLSHEDYEDYTITVTGDNENIARENAIAKFNDILGEDSIELFFGDGGTLSVNLEYENVIIPDKPTIEVIEKHTITINGKEHVIKMVDWTDSISQAIDSEIVKNDTDDIISFILEK